MAEAQCSRAEDVAAPWVHLRLAARLRQVAHDLVEGLGGAPVLFLLVGRELQGNDGNRQRQCLGKATGIVLNEFRSAGGTDNHCLGLEARIGLGGGGLEQFRRVAAQVACLECGVGHGRAGVAALDHGEQQVGVGVALRGVQHIVQSVHCRGDAHGADMRRAFIGPQGELHLYTPSLVRRSMGRENRRARSPACS